MTDIKWESPTDFDREKQSTRGGKYVDFANALRSNPGEWAILPGDKFASIAVQIKSGALTDFRPAGSFEATARNVQSDQRATIYARYVGAPEEVI